MKARQLVMPLIGILAIGTGLMAWRADFFSFEPQIIPPGNDALIIQGLGYDSIQEATQQLKLSGFIKKGDLYLAIVNGEVVEVGSRLRVQIGREDLVLIVDSISAERIIVSVEGDAAG
jgi:hypothetical protein